MPRFAYAAIDATGTSVEGVTKADTIGDARTSLLNQNLYPVKIQERRGALDFELTQKKVKKKELMQFTRQLAVFVRAGIPITEAMEIIGDETQDVALQRTITEMVDDLRNGGTLSEAAAKHPEAFPGYYIGITGIVTFKNAAYLRDIVCMVPADRLLIDGHEIVAAGPLQHGESHIIQKILFTQN